MTRLSINDTVIDTVIDTLVGTLFEDFSPLDISVLWPVLHFGHGRVQNGQSFPKRVTIQSELTIRHEFVRSMTENTGNDEIS